MLRPRRGERCHLSKRTRVPAEVVRMWGALDEDERDLVLLLIDALAEGLLEGDEVWDRYRTAVDALRPEIGFGTLTAEQVHESALHIAHRDL